jgi:phosphatidylinositol-3-phosphatase
VQHRRRSTRPPLVRRLCALSLAACTLLTAACGGASRTGEPRAAARSTNASAGTGTGTPSTGSPTATEAPSKVLVIIEENHSYAQMRAEMPYLFRLSERYGYATHWTAITHPSLPNYLAIAGGTTFGITDDLNPAAHDDDIGRARSVFDQAIDAGKSARTYVESMPSSDRCRLDDYPAGLASYAVRHNPWTYFPASRSRCRAGDVPLDGFAAAARRDALPNVAFLIPNLCDDAHNCPLVAADAFLKRTLPDVLSSHDFSSGRLTVVVTADEDDRHSGNVVLTSVLSTHLSGKVVSTHLTDYSLTRYIAEVLGVTPLGHGRTAPDMKAAFGL